MSKLSIDRSAFGHQPINLEEYKIHAQDLEQVQDSSYTLTNNGPYKRIWFKNKEGKAVGLMSWLYPNGKVKAQMCHEETRPSSQTYIPGQYKEWFETDTLEVHQFYSCDTMKLHGEAKVWYASGQKNYHKFYRDGMLQGEFTSYYVDGQVQYHLFYRDDKKHGEYKEYYPNGSTYRHRHYSDGEKVSEPIQNRPEPLLKNIPQELTLVGMAKPKIIPQQMVQLVAQQAQPVKQNPLGWTIDKNNYLAHIIASKLNMSIKTFNDIYKSDIAVIEEIKAYQFKPSIVKKINMEIEGQIKAYNANKSLNQLLVLRNWIGLKYILTNTINEQHLAIHQDIKHMISSINLSYDVIKTNQVFNSLKTAQQPDKKYMQKKIKLFDSEKLCDILDDKGIDYDSDETSYYNLLSYLQDAYPNEVAELQKLINYQAQDLDLGKLAARINTIEQAMV